MNGVGRNDVSSAFHATTFASHFGLRLLFACLLSLPLGCRGDTPDDNQTATVSPQAEPSHLPEHTQQGSGLPEPFSPPLQDMPSAEPWGKVEPFESPEDDDRAPKVPHLEFEMLEPDDAEEELAEEPEIELHVGVAHATFPAITGNNACDYLLLSLDFSILERPTVVVWIIDQSASMEHWRASELPKLIAGLKEVQSFQAEGGSWPTKGPPLLNAVLAFGTEVTPVLNEPTADYEALQQAMESIPADTSGIENSFQAIDTALTQFQRYRYVDPDTQETPRNLVFVLVTDENGSDAANPQHGLEMCIQRCHDLRVCVHVLGTAAPLGRSHADFRWRNLALGAEHSGQQSVQTGEISLGPETPDLERIQVHFPRGEVEPIDSCFGPYALSRLCEETRGFYLLPYPTRPDAVQPYPYVQAEDAAIGDKLEPLGPIIDPATFDPSIMWRYRPAYLSPHEYRNQLNHHACRWALVEAASRTSQLPAWDAPFVFSQANAAEFDEAVAAALSRATSYRQTISGAYELLAQQERVRAEEEVPRWQAGYDLALGQLLAMKVRLENYHELMAVAARGELPPLESEGTTWQLAAVHELPANSEQLEFAQRAQSCLQRVIEEHPGTPWALLAERELQYPLGWRWVQGKLPANGVLSDQVGEELNSAMPQPVPAL